MRVVLAVVGIAALIVGCSDGGSPSRSPSGSPSGSSSGSPPPASGSPAASAASPTDPALAAIVDPVLADAAARLSVAVSNVRVVSVDAVTWSDGSLGCPKPGELYTQALVDGHRVVVSAAGTTLDYRVTGPGAFRVCENPPTTEP